MDAGDEELLRKLVCNTLSSTGLLLMSIWRNSLFLSKYFFSFCLYFSCMYALSKIQVKPT